MDDKEQRTTLLTVLTTEHFVLQTAANAAVSEGAARSSLYVLSLSSSLVAIGFATQSETILVPFVATILPAMFLLGVFTVIRLVDTALEYTQCLSGIARIRSYYRTLSPEATEFFATRTGRWPESSATPALRLGVLVAFLTTAASMVALINGLVAGTGVALLAWRLLGRSRSPLAVTFGILTTALFMTAFLAYQRWRYGVLESLAREGRQLDARGE